MTRAEKAAGAGTLLAGIAAGMWGAGMPWGVVAFGLLAGAGWGLAGWLWLADRGWARAAAAWAVVAVLPVPLLWTVIAVVPWMAAGPVAGAALALWAGFLWALWARWARWQWRQARGWTREDIRVLDGRVPLDSVEYWPRRRP